MTEKELITLLSEDPRRGLEQAVRQYTPYIMKIVRTKLDGICTKEDLEETVSDVFMMFYRYVTENKNEIGSVKALLAVMSRRRCADVYEQSLKHRDDIPIDELPEIAANDSLENDKAKTISVGDTAEVTNSWWYDDVTGAVSAIRPDPSDPNRKKEVTLSLTGSLTAGQTITMTVASKTANYDSIVPSSAVRGDTKGKFVLVVESKPSPLGNRYYAVRRDVEVLAEDDTKTAIQGAFADWGEYVVTTASKSIEPGAEVRLSEN